jgi:hypothetical protein
MCSIQTKQPTQRIGIRPDVYIEPTIAGIRAGRDKVLENAVQQILGTSASPATLEKMAKRLNQFCAQLGDHSETAKSQQTYWPSPHYNCRRVKRMPWFVSKLKNEAFLSFSIFTKKA